MTSDTTNESETPLPVLSSDASEMDEPDTPEFFEEAEESQSPSGWLDTLKATTGDIIALFQRSPEWLVIIAAWIAAAVIPYSWYIKDSTWWSDPTSTLFFQPFVPLFVAALLWQDQEDLYNAWMSTPRSKRRGPPWILWAGCLVLFVAHMVHVVTFAALGLLIIAVGIVYMAYGPLVLRKASRALLFGLLFISPPETVMSTIVGRVADTILKLVVFIAQRLGKLATVTVGTSPATFTLPDHTIIIQTHQAAALIFTGFLMLFLGVWNRRKAGDVLIGIAIGEVIVLTLSILLLFASVLPPANPLANPLAQVHPLLVAAISVTASYFLQLCIKGWGKVVARRSAALGEFSNLSQKATERATANLAAGISNRVSGTSRGVNKKTEKAIDNFFRALSKPFKKKKSRWER